MAEGVVFRGCQLPPGFRFQPTDEEIILCYLRKKIAATAAAVTSIIADVDIYKFDPWELPGKAMFGEVEWFFFSPRDRKYPNGERPNRTAGSGYWKATGTDKPILAASGTRCLGVKKALVFYQGRSPRGNKTEWVMHEYRLLNSDSTVALNRSTHSMRLDDWVLCRVRKKGGAAAAAAFAPATTSESDYHSGWKGGEAAAPREVHGSTVGDDWTDGQLLQYLIGGGGATQDVVNGAAAGAHRGGVTGACGESSSRALVSVLETIKRNLSLPAVDDLYLLQPSSKRAKFVRAGADEEEQLSPAASFSLDADEIL